MILSVKGLNTMIKRQRLTEWISKSLKSMFRGDILSILTHK